MIEWNDKYSVNISLIDEQHKNFIGIINKAIIAKKQSEDANEVLGILNEMTGYTFEHFETEERYMKEFNFPENLTHRKEHNNFIDNVLYYKNKVVGGDSQIINEILEYLKQWLVYHIEISDKKYSDYFIKMDLNKFSEVLK